MGITLNAEFAYLFQIAPRAGQRTCERVVAHVQRCQLQQSHEWIKGLIKGARHL